MRAFCFTLLIATVAAGQAAAGTTITAQYQRATYTQSTHAAIALLTATSDAGNIIGFNFDPVGGTGYGITGPLIQIVPFGQQNVFNDVAWSILRMAGVINDSDDTYFLARSVDGIVTNPAESADSLSGAFDMSDTSGATPVFPLAQLVGRIGDTVAYRGTFTVATPAGNVLEEVQGSVTFVPEPAALALGGLGALGLLIARRCAIRVSA